MIRKSAQVTISDEIGWATYSNADYALDFSNVSGLTAYAVKVTGNTIELSAVTKTPKGTGLLLQGAKGDYGVSALAEAPAAVENNDLLPTTGASVAADGFVCYGLTKKDNKAVFGKIGNFAPSKGKAYLKVSEPEARDFYAIEDNTTGINTVQGSAFMVNGSDMYNLNGQRVGNLTKGLYIMNGKKVVVK